MAESKFSPKVYVKVYMAAREGCKQNKIAHLLGVSLKTYVKWVRKYPLIQWSIDMARGNIRNDKGKRIGETFHEYVYGRLDAETKRIWDRLELVSKNCDEDDSLSIVRDITRGKGKRMMQSLFVHALMSSNFNASEACRKVGVSRKRLEIWREEHDFRSLLDGIKEVKKDFCEAALMGLIQQGDSAATIFANSTLNRDRGFGKTISLEHNGVIRHEHIEISELPLPIEIKRQVLTAIRQYKEAKVLPEKQITVIPHEVKTSEQLIEEEL
jgi:hypothetical protein